VPGLFRCIGMGENGVGGGDGVAHDVRVSVLGGFVVQLDGRPVPDEVWRRNRARALVKLLALAPGQRLHREELMDALWPSLDAEAAAGNLRKAIHFARRALGAEHIRFHGDLIALEAPGLWVDIHSFEAAAQAGQRSEATSSRRIGSSPGPRIRASTSACASTACSSTKSHHLSEAATSRRQRTPSTGW
jgi:two-component SAPR family response regulator